MPVSRFTEKPGGARDVYLWDLRIERSLPRSMLDWHLPEFAVHLDIRFHTEQAAVDFEKALRALLPGIENDGD